MISLNIQLGSSIEPVSATLLKKLYEAALSIPEPEEGEEDAAYLSGTLLLSRAYRSHVAYLTTRFPDLHITGISDSDYYIEFEDPAVESVLLANNIGDGIGITINQASNATVGTLFKNNTTITSFPELTYFTRTNTTLSSDAFSGCSNLTSVVVSNVTRFGDNCFANCSNLELDASLLSNATAIGWLSFIRCSKLTGTLNAPNLTGMVRYAFRHTGLTAINSLGSITEILSCCFLECSLLQSVTLPSTLTSIRSESFRDCTSLTSININQLSNVTILENKAFCRTGLSGTLDVTNWTLLNSIGDDAFASTNITKLIYPSVIANKWNGKCFFRASDKLQTIETDIENWRYPFRASGCTSLTPFVIYQPLLRTPLTDLDYGAMFGGGWWGETGGPHDGHPEWSHIYWPNIEVLWNKYIYSNNSTGDNVGLFAARSQTKIHIFYTKDVTTIDQCAFVNCDVRWVINNTSVPKIYAHSQNSITTTETTWFMDIGRGKKTNSSSSNFKIYVPNSAVSDYKSAWPDYADDILGIGELNKITVVDVTTGEKKGTVYRTEADWKAGGEEDGLIAEYLGLDSNGLAAFMLANDLVYYTPTT